MYYESGRRAVSFPDSEFVYNKVIFLHNNYTVLGLCNADSVDFPQKLFGFRLISPEHLTIYAYSRVIMRGEKYARAKIYKYVFYVRRTEYTERRKKRVYLLISWWSWILVMRIVLEPRKSILITAFPDRRAQSTEIMVISLCTLSNKLYVLRRWDR